MKGDDNCRTLTMTADALSPTSDTIISEQGKSSKNFPLENDRIRINAVNQTDPGVIWRQFSS